MPAGTFTLWEKQRTGLMRFAIGDVIAVIAGRQADQSRGIAANRERESRLGTRHKYIEIPGIIVIDLHQCQFVGAGSDRCRQTDGCRKRRCRERALGNVDVDQNRPHPTLLTAGRAHQYPLLAIVTTRVPQKE